MLSKTGIAPFPLAMLAVLWWKQGKLVWKRDILPVVPFFIAGLLFGLLTIYIEKTHIGTRGPGYEFSVIERCLIAGRAFWFYLGKILLPVNLTISYPRWALNTAVWWQYLFPIAALTAAGILWAKRKAWRAPAAAFFFFIAMILPYLGFLSLFAFRYSFVADHYQYIAAIGPMVLGAALIDRALGSVRKNGRVLKPALIALLLLALGIATRNQSGMYSDAETLYRTTITRNDKSWMAHNNLGLLLANRGRTDEAVVHYQKAMDLKPDYAEANNNLGLLLMEKGRPDEAMAYFLKSLEINPAYGGARFNLALLLANTGRVDEAVTQYRKALEQNPNHAKTHNNLGLLLAGMGRTDEAMNHYRKALALNPVSAETHYNAALLLANTGQTEDALTHLQKALKLRPDFVQAHSNAGILLANRGRFDEALSHFQSALEGNANDAGAHYNLGLLLEKMGRIEEAAAHRQKALDLERRP